MNRLMRSSLFATLLVLFLAVAADAARPPADAPAVTIGPLDIGDGLTLRRMVVRPRYPRGTVLLLHGFPETLAVWREIALVLGADHEVHAIDWPGFGQSSRPLVERFAYAPRDYSAVLRRYLAAAAIDRSRLTIYATDIGALPVLLLALDEPDVARRIIVGDFAPFDRPQHMYTSLQSLKGGPTAEPTRTTMNRNRDEILANAFRRGLPAEAQFEVPCEAQEDLARGWGHGSISSADAFAHYYSHFTRDQAHFEANLHRLATPVKVMWGERDIYIRKEMGEEFARRAGLELTVLPGVGHYPHLQVPGRVIAEIQSSFSP